jgi:hypothetical protein
MALFRFTRTIAACAAALAVGGALSACGEEVGTAKTPAREGLAVHVAGVYYNIFITRQLNLRITPDRAYYNGPPAGPNKTLYGVFLQACGTSNKRVRTVPPDNFFVEDNQGNVYRPKPLPRSNPFAYQSVFVSKDQCFPTPGSVAQQGPTAASMLLFEFPLQNTENRPLTLHIKGPFNLLTQKQESKLVELDL